VILTIGSFSAIYPIVLAYALPIEQYGRGYLAALSSDDYPIDFLFDAVMIDVVSSLR
jgi:hypothetical protein